MPIIRPIPSDPTDLVLQGEQMRVSVLDEPVLSAGLVGGVSVNAGFSSLVPDEDAFLPMNSLIEINRLSIRRQKNSNLQVRTNAGIATPCGGWIPLDYTPLINPFMQASVLWFITGVTKDSTQAPLGNCRVVGLETGRIENENIQAEVGETISDGSGNYTLPVPMNTAYQLTGYKAGSPDVAGITRNDVTPNVTG